MLLALDEKILDEFIIYDFNFVGDRVIP